MFYALHVPHPENHVPCIARVIKNRVESHALQANSCDNLNKGYCKLGQVKGDYSGRERANSYAPPNKRSIHPIRMCCATCYKSVDRSWLTRP